MPDLVALPQIVYCWTYNFSLMWHLLSDSVISIAKTQLIAIKLKMVVIPALCRWYVPFVFIIHRLVALNRICPTCVPPPGANKFVYFACKGQLEPEDERQIWPAVMRFHIWSVVRKSHELWVMTKQLGSQIQLGLLSKAAQISPQSPASSLESSRCSSAIKKKQSRCLLFKWLDATGQTGELAGLRTLVIVPEEPVDEAYQLLRPWLTMMQTTGNVSGVIS